MDKILRFYLASILAFLILAGCSEIQKSKPAQIITHPWDSNKSSVRIGYTKELVLEKWGKPDEVLKHGTDKWGMEQEEWIYRASFPEIPVDYNYFSKNKHLHFDGNNLVGYKDEEEARREDKEK